MADAICKTCPWWESSSDEFQGICHHATRLPGEDPASLVGADWWCSEHPLRQRDRLAEAVLPGIVTSYRMEVPGAPEAAARCAYMVADAMLAERAKGTP